MLYRILTPLPYHATISSSVTYMHLTQFLRVTALVPAIRLQIRRRRFEVALEDIIGNADAQRDAADRKLLARPIGPRAGSHISNILCVLILGCSIGIDIRGHKDILGGEGIEAPVDA